MFCCFCGFFFFLFNFSAGDLGGTTRVLEARDLKSDGVGEGEAAFY